MFIEVLLKRSYDVCEIPHQRQLSKSIDSNSLLIQAAEILNCNFGNFQKTVRVSQSGYNGSRHADLFDVAVGPTDQPSDWWKVWLNLFGCESAGWRFHKFGLLKQRKTVGDWVNLFMLFDGYKILVRRDTMPCRTRLRKPGVKSTFDL